jgi:hypothetical protein
MGGKIFGFMLAWSILGLSMCAAPDASMIPVADEPIPNPAPRSAVRHLEHSVADHPVASDHPTYEAIDRKIDDLRHQVDDLHRRIEKQREPR